MSNRRIFPTHKVMSNQRNPYYNKEDAIEELLKQKNKGGFAFLDRASGE